MCWMDSTTSGYSSDLDKAEVENRTCVIVIDSSGVIGDLLATLVRLYYQ